MLCDIPVKVSAFTPNDGMLYLIISGIYKDNRCGAYRNRYSTFAVGRSQSVNGAISKACSRLSVADPKRTFVKLLLDDCKHHTGDIGEYEPFLKTIVQN